MCFVNHGGSRGLIFSYLFGIKFEKIFSKVLEKNFACSLGWLESLESSRSQLIEFIALFIAFPFARW